jgi:hypothetical protein
VLRNLRQRLALLAKVICAMCLRRGGLQPRTLHLTPPWPALRTAFCLASAAAVWPASATVPDYGA